MTRPLESVLEAILAGVLVLDREGRVEELNSTASRMLDRSRESAVGRSVEEVAPPAHAIARLGREALHRGLGFSESRQPIERRRQEDALVDVAATPLFDPAGELDGAVVVLRDRSSRDRLEQLEREQERLEDFGRIAIGLAHEIKNPLGGIRGAGEILARRHDDPKTREIADLVVREATRIAGLVDELMVFARRDALSLDTLNLHQVIDHVLGLASLEPGAGAVAFERHFDPSIPELLGDRNRLVQVLLNLVRNALQAIGPQEGTVAITTRIALDHRLVTDEGRSIPTLHILIEDTGCGMAPEELRQANTPFFTTRSGGTGLGLAVADYWIAQHGGSLDIESEKGAGTRVRISLPLRRSAR